MTENRKLFVRDATGLVRSLGLLDQFFISQGIAATLIGFVFTALYAPYFFPGADLRIVFLIGSIPAFAMAAVYGIFSAGMPRSGGDYVWSTRIMGPLYGTIQLVFIFVTAIVIMGLPGTAFTSMGLSQLFFSLGATTSNHGYLGIANALTQPVDGWIVTMILVIILTTIALLGMRFFSWFYKVATSFFIIGNAGFIILLLVLNSSSFPGIFNAAMHVAGSNATYTNIISQAASAGAPTTNFSLTNTLLASIPWGFLTFTGWNFGTYLSGETKNIKTSMFRALMLSTAVTAIVLIVTAVVMYNAFGSTFLNAASYVASSSPSSLPTLPTPTVLLSLTSPAVALFLGITVVPGFAITCLGWMVTLPRMLFAASFDRLLPKKFADVNDRFHSPQWATLFIAVVFAVWMTILWFAGFASSWLNTSLVSPIGFLLPLVAALAFPLRKKELFKSTVGLFASSRTVIVASLVGIIAFIFYIFAETYPISSGIFLGANLALAYGVVAVLAIVGVSLYSVAKYRMNKSGVDIRQIYSEIPPE